MIEQIVFNATIPVLGVRIEYSDQFHAEDGWEIAVNGSTVELTRTAKEGHWTAVPTFKVHGFAFTYREREAKRSKGRST